MSLEGVVRCWQQSFRPLVPCVLCVHNSGADVLKYSCSLCNMACCCLCFLILFCVLPGNAVVGSTALHSVESLAGQASVMDLVLTVVIISGFFFLAFMCGSGCKCDQCLVASSASCIK